MEERKPLAPRSNLSKLPVPGMRMKRARSPDDNEEFISGKKTRMDNNDIKNNAEHVASTRSLSSLSITSVSSNKSTTTKKLRKSVSSSNVTKNSVGRSMTNKIANTVKAQRNATLQARTLSSTVAKPKPTGAVTGKTVFLNNSTLNSAVTGKPASLNNGALNSAVTGKPASLNNSALNSTVTNTGAPKKRPAWDLKGRIQDMEAHIHKQAKDNTSLLSQFSVYSERIGQLESQNQQLSGHVAQKEMASESALQEIQNLRNKLSKTEEVLDSTKNKFQREIENLEFHKSSLERQKVTLEGELSAFVKEVSVLKMTIAELVASQSSLQSDLDNTKIQLKRALTDIAEKTWTITQRDASINLYQQRERDHETERRKLHNTIQELKGNIRVFCRVRPLLEEEQLGNGGIISHMSFPDMDMKVLELDKLPDISVNESVLNATRGSKSVSKYEFSFDKVFQPESTQAEVFEELSQLIQSALDGYNVCIFAYGQTGSGKTFTMEGCLNDESTLGMIPRTVYQIFKTTTDLQRKGWEYTCQVSMLEIYNETIRDLLGKGKDDKLEIKIQGKADNEVYVPNLTVVDVKTENQVLSLLKTAAKNRAVAETKCNDRSSRSHSVFQMKLSGSNSITGESCKGMLNLIDLAGSERIKVSGSEGQRLVEAQSINKSLSNLGNVIMALGKKDKHIPYRNSKLTYLLQNSLGGNSKTLMFVNVSPKEECFSETLNSLRFATKVNQCNIGTAQKRK